MLKQTRKFSLFFFFFMQHTIDLCMVNGVSARAVSGLQHSAQEVDDIACEVQTCRRGM